SRFCQGVGGKWALWHQPSGVQFPSVFIDWVEYESTLPISLSVVLSVVLIILIIIRVVQCCQARKSKTTKAVDSTSQSTDAHAKPDRTPPKEKFIKAIKSKGVSSAAVPPDENGSLLKSGIRANPTRKAENKSWYDSKVIPFIDDGSASLDNLYFPENAIHEVV
uniref:Uncharacterized protein n=1 Tax=Mesocestoides corti TaxID=53468 RepID=A0A5K3G1E0_MESCO